jgi:hypothetical protein
MRIAIRGYAGDCTLTGQLDVAGGRLSDVLNSAEALSVQEAVLTALADGREVEAGLIEIERDDLFALEPAHAPAGDDQRRVRTVRHALRAQAGPYVVFGDVHTLPGVAPLRIFNDRRAMVPMTNCVIRYDAAGQTQVRRAPLLLVNAQLIAAVDLASAEQVEEELAAASG